MTPKVAGIVRLGAALAFLVALPGCSGGEADGPGASVPTGGVSATPRPSASVVPSEPPVFGPEVVRVLAVRRASTGLSFDVVGPADSRYGLRDSAGKKAECRQVERGEVAALPPGLPPTSNRQTELICVSREEVTKASRVLVKVSRGSFTYDFEVPALPPR